MIVDDEKALAELVASGVRIPPLRERLDDIRWFVRHFVEVFNR